MATCVTGSCMGESLCHVAKGTGYCLGASGCTLTIISVTTIVVGVALGLFLSEGFYIYPKIVRATSDLFWAIPVSLAGMTLCTFFLLEIGKAAIVFNRWTASGAKHCGDRMIAHFRAIPLSAQAPE